MEGKEEKEHATVSTEHACLLPDLHRHGFPPPDPDAMVFRLGCVCIICFFLSHFKAHCRHGILSPLHTSGARSVTQVCPILCSPMDCHPPGSSVRRIFQARILEWVAISSSRGIFLTQGSNPDLPQCRQMLYHLSHQGSHSDKLFFSPGCATQLTLP